MASSTVNVKIKTNISELIELLNDAEKEATALKTTLDMIKNFEVEVKADY